jgi:hypothetical protein
MPAPDPALTLQLRAELKDWEHAFAAAHNGRKPSREEVKKDPVISAKYKAYNKLRSAKPAAPPQPAISKPQHTPRGAHHDDPFASAKSSQSTSASTRKVPEMFKTPTKPTLTPADQQEIYDSPLSLRRTRLFGNRHRETVGPTPQKCGRVMGLFESFCDVDSPPAKVPASDVTATAGFSTPRKRKAGEISAEGGSPAKDEFTTPSFLRRDSFRFASSFLESPPALLPMKPIGGLSIRGAEIRKMEEEALREQEEALRREEEAFCEDEEAMRELENAEGGGPTLPRPPPPKKKPRGSIDLGVVALPPGAFVEEGRVDENKDKDNDKPKWKKRGLKRQTKRTISTSPPFSPQYPFSG